jgi:molybdate transport system ATP-binding protein
VDAAELGDRKPAELSGGQAQRIAVARALASDPDLLLLDEPMAALDVTVAPNLRRLLRRVLADRTAIIVTHEVLDAYTLADRVVVVNDGHIVEQGPTREVLDRPRTRFTADLAALNLLTGTRTGSGIVMSTGASVAAVAYSDSGMGLVDGVAAAVAVRPSAVSIGVSRPSESGLNVFSGVVTDIEPRGDVVRVRIDGLAADVSPAIVADLDLVPGSPAVMSFAAADAVAYAL